MRYTAILTEPFHQVAYDLLGEDWEIVKCKPDAEGIEIARGIGAIAAIIGGWKFGPEVMDQMPSLLVVARPGIGVDAVDLEAAADRGILVINTPDGPTVSTAEHTVALLLALAKRHKAGARLLATGGSPHGEPMLIELKDKVLGILGLGRIGGTVASICRQGFGMKVLGFDPYVSQDRVEALGVTRADTAEDVLRGSDFVSIHIPATEETRHLINAQMLALMKPSAYLINCARGPIVDEAALVEALRAGELAGAGLDVFDIEPPSVSNPLLAMENVVATPHSAGFTEDSLRKMHLQLAKQLVDIVNGIRPSNLVNPRAWEVAVERGRIPDRQ